MQFAGKKGFWTLVILGVGLLGFVGWRIYNSYATVTFTFNPSHGQVRLTNTSRGEIAVSANQPVRLLKGEYTLSRYGRFVEPESELVRIDGSWKSRILSFSFTPAKLAELYADEQPAITEAIAARYPRLNELYTLRQEALYGRGEYFGATLYYNDRTSDQRDTLHLLAYKKAGEWRILSTPPEPILSKQNYESVPPGVLKAINRAR